MEGRSSKRLKASDMDNTISMRLALANKLIEVCFAGDLIQAQNLIREQADAWIQNDDGQTALHAAVYSGSLELVQYLLRSSNAVWNLTDSLGCSAGDIAYSLNQTEIYQLILDEGVRAELLKAMMRKMAGSPAPSDDEDAEKDEGLASTAGSNRTFLASKLEFITDSNGQEICRDIEGNGVMMGWERLIMEKTADALCKDRINGEEFAVMNVGFGLGIIDAALQSYSPTYHLIIEPHPDVLAHARAKGWFEKEGVRIYEGTWRQFQDDIEEGIETIGRGFDAVYFDTYSEHYHDLHAFFRCVPSLLHSSSSVFSFFNGLGATERLFYDIYTIVSETHLKKIGLITEWSEVEVRGGGQSWVGLDKRYWGDVGPYRLPICAMSL